jgi:hypothetical protein
LKGKSFNTGKSVFLIFVILFTLIGSKTPRVQADSPPERRVGVFSTADEGTVFPDCWETLTFKKIPRQTQYRIVKEDDTPVVQAISQAAASGLTCKIKIDLKEYPVLQWRWKILNIISKSNVRTKEGDDYPARIYVTFQYDPEKAGFKEKAKFKIGQMLFGDVPVAAINYIWGNKTPRETIVASAYTDRSRLIVVESGDENVDRWMEEERNVYEDYRRAFGDEPPLVNGIAIMTDTDNTGETATAYYGDIIFKKANR